ncbi:hypothetical protein ACM66B_003173 [Microbotryomycetes sp. NB124-2]
MSHVPETRFETISQAIEHAEPLQIHQLAGILFASRLPGQPAHSVFQAAFVPHSAMWKKFLKSFDVELSHDGSVEKFERNPQSWFDGMEKALFLTLTVTDLFFGKERFFLIPYDFDRWLDKQLAQQFRTQVLDHALLVIKLYHSGQNWIKQYVGDWNRFEKVMAQPWAVTWGQKSWPTNVPLATLFSLSRSSVSQRDTEPHAVVSKLVWAGSRLFLRPRNHRLVPPQLLRMLAKFCVKPVAEAYPPRQLDHRGRRLMSWLVFEKEPVAVKCFVALLIMMLVTRYDMIPDFEDELKDICTRFDFDCPSYNWTAVPANAIIEFDSFHLAYFNVRQATA